MKNLLTTTAILVALSGAAFAESHSSSEESTDVDTTMSTDAETSTDAVTLTDTEMSTDAETSTDADATMSTDAEPATPTPAPTMGNDMAIGSVGVMTTDFLASDLIGMRVYNVEDDVDASAPVMADAETEWDDIGEINDIIVTAEGNVSAVILGIGGFLGIGERDVSVPMSAITVLTEQDNGDRFLVVKTSKEELENSPAFDREMN